MLGGKDYYAMKHGKNFSYAKYGYIFCIPFFAIYLIFSLYPIIYTISISVTDRQGAGVDGIEYGIQKRALVDEEQVPLFEEVEKAVTNEVVTPIIDIMEVPIFEDGVNVGNRTDEIHRRSFMGHPLYIVEGVVVIDRHGNEVFDNSGDPVYVEGERRGDDVIYYTQRERGVDEYGNPAYRTIETPLLDEFGEPQTVLDPLGNFRWVLNSPMFREAIGNTFKIWITNFIPQIVLALTLAAWFTSRWSKIKGQGLFKVLFYMPNIITAGTIAVLFNALFAFPMGVVNNTLTSIGIFESAKNFGTDGTAQQAIVAFVQFWMWYGYTMLIFISGIIGLNPEMYESADIDGASAVKQFFYITLPNLRTIMIFTVVSSIIGGLNMFDVPFLYAGGGPATVIGGGSTTTTSIWIYNQAFGDAYRYNTASAASVLMFLIIAVLSAIIFFIMRDKEEVRMRKYKKAELKALKKSVKAVD
ncbi:MAG: sugar ABC transporter permease [Oscillospiraceae bacterium]|nr:sugar ABC transporter permease [Oscillospiraceae bacterium]